jgi:hypothetical protein
MGITNGRKNNIMSRIPMYAPFFMADNLSKSIPYRIPQFGIVCQGIVCGVVLLLTTSIITNGVSIPACP